MALAPEVPDDEDFSQQRYLSILQTIMSDKGDISMSAYVALIEEMTKLMIRFGEEYLELVLPEVKENMNLLKEFCGEDFGPDYATVQAMLDYECRNNLVQPKSGLPSGTHTLLRFHRILEFIHKSLEMVQDMSVSDEEFPGEIVNCYTETMGRFEPELMVANIEWALPTFVMSRVRLMEKTGFIKDPLGFWVWLRQMTDHLKKVNDAVHTVYEKYQLHDFPQD